MRKVIFFLVGLFSISLAIAQREAQVVRVIDGDTFIAHWGGENYTCRLEHVDAPELKQHYGHESYRALRDLISGHPIMVTPHKVDFYGRRLVTVTLDNKRIDSILIRDGYAWHYVNYSKDGLLKQCMQNAVDQKLGLWECGKERVCPPWLYRRYDFRNKLHYCPGCD